MANLYDYLTWRGDISFEERPFNDADNVILAALAYLDLTGIVAGERQGRGIALSLACQRLLERSGDDVTPFVRSLARLDTRFVELVGQTRRFGSAVLHSYADIVDEARSLQFAAIQVDLPSGETYVSFRGTDTTLVGWRENFMLGFEVTEAQREARDYLERALVRAQERGRQVLVGGHSKGGNLAEYASVTCTPDLRACIARVYTNDGPGMSPDVMRADSREVLGDLLVRIVPTYSVIGMLFARPDDARTIVRSSGTGIGQHDPTTWQMLPTGLDEGDELLPECRVLNESIAAWAADVPLDERERMTDEVFDALEVGGASTFEEIAATPEAGQRVLRALRETDDQTRELVMALVERTVNTSAEAMREAISQWGRDARAAADDARRRLLEASEELRQGMRP